MGSITSYFKHLILIVPIRINLKLIKCEFWLNFILFYFFNKKCFPLWHLICSFEKQFGEKNIWSMKKFKKKKKVQKTLLSSAATWIAFLAWKKLKFSFLYLWKNCRELNFISKNTNLESIAILNRKLKLKYETSAEDNTSSASSSTSFQNSNEDQHQIRSSSFKQIYLLP